LGALAASLLIGVAWAAWHTPLFFDPNSTYAQLPPAVFVARMVGLTVIFTWLVNGTGGSLLFPMLLHSVINASGQIWAAVPDLGVTPTRAASHRRDLGCGGSGYCRRRPALRPSGA